MISALDKRWLPKVVLHKFEPFSILQGEEENTTFLFKNMLFLDGLDYLLNCNYHQFWCTILFEPTVAIALRSFLLNPILPFQVKYLEGEYLQLYETVFTKYLLVYEKLLTFKQSEVSIIRQYYQ